MRCYWLVPKDNRRNNWILYDGGRKGIAVREQYRDLCCSQCGKLDEGRAIARGLDEDLRLKTTFDINTTDDGFVYFKCDIWHQLVTLGVHGVSTIPIPGDREHLLVVPDPRLEIDVDVARSGTQFHRQCPQCGRFRETTFFPMLESIALPSDPLQIWGTVAQTRKYTWPRFLAHRH